MSVQSLRESRNFLMQALMQKGQESRAEKRRKQRAESIKQNYMQLRGQYMGEGPRSEEELAEEKKIGAYANLVAEGATPPSELLEEPAGDFVSPFEQEYQAIMNNWGVPKDDPFRIIATKTPEYSEKPNTFLNGLNMYVPKGEITKEDFHLLRQVPGLLNPDYSDEYYEALIKFSDKLLTKESSTKLVGLTPPSSAEANRAAAMKILYDKEGNILPYDRLTATQKIELSSYGISDAELKAAHNISDDDVGADVILWAKKQIVQQIFSKAAFEGMAAQAEGKTFDYSKTINDVIKLLNDNELPSHLQNIVDDVMRRGGNNKYSKDEMRKQLEDARQKNSDFSGLSDAEITLVLQAIYKHGK